VLTDHAGPARLDYTLHPIAAGRHAQTRTHGSLQLLLLLLLLQMAMLPPVAYHTRKHSSPENTAPTVFSLGGGVGARASRSMPCRVGPAQNSHPDQRCADCAPVRRPTPIRYNSWIHRRITFPPVGAQVRLH